MLPASSAQGFVAPGQWCCPHSHRPPPLFLPLQLASSSVSSPSLCLPCLRPPSSHILLYPSHPLSGHSLLCPTSFNLLIAPSLPLPISFPCLLVLFPFLITCSCPSSCWLPQYRALVRILKELTSTPHPPPRGSPTPLSHSVRGAGTLGEQEEGHGRGPEHGGGGGGVCILAQEEGVERAGIRTVHIPGFRTLPKPNT